MSAGDDALPPTVTNILNQETLRWVFVGGKGGVGKTSCSCALATLLSTRRQTVLLMSTDPAHNVSDAFSQKFTHYPTLVQGFNNLYAMEIDPTAAIGMDADDDDDDLKICAASESSSDSQSTFSASLKCKMREFTKSLPAVDEFMTYTEVLGLVRRMDFSIVVFDTAPTGHTLRLLSFPEMMEKTAKKFVSIKNKFGPVLNQVSAYFGFGGMDSENLIETVEERIPFMRQMTEQFRNPLQTTFICVCIPEYLSMYETERLVQELGTQQIDVHNVIINQLLCPPNPDDPPCTMCNARRRQQKKYVDQLLMLYDDMHVIMMPALEEEIRETHNVKNFAKFMIEPHQKLRDAYVTQNN